MATILALLFRKEPSTAGAFYSVGFCNHRSSRQDFQHSNSRPKSGLMHFRLGSTQLGFEGYQQIIEAELESLMKEASESDIG